MTGRPVPWAPDEVAALRVQAKKLLRQRLRTLREQVPPALHRQHCAAMTARVLALPAWAAAETVALYITFGDEFDTTGLIAAARAAGKRVVLPRAREAGPMVFHAMWGADGAELPRERSAFGVETPREDAPVVAPEEIDLVLVPALAVDDRGHRIGYGRAHYDQTLPLLQRAVRVAAVFAFQRLVEVPDEPHDATVGVVVTEHETLEAAPEPRLAAPETESK
ncbi:MAG: 5-formyltetrahydrofolate cyclo-ligase [Myxococcales bacterium]|nr:5-formyltetrahydrofolate cyclo-ligase [Myxococcales bacterium]